jgi:hypothetical protein
MMGLVTLLLLHAIATWLIVHPFSPASFSTRRTISFSHSFGFCSKGVPFVLSARVVDSADGSS